jgi:hypothetical protein
MSSYKCDNCNIIYENRSGLWKHNKKHHPIVAIIDDNKFKCSYCIKKFTHRQNKWRHQQKCKNKIKVENQANIVQNNVIQNNSNNNTNSNNTVIININAIGDEDISKITKTQMKAIFNENMNCLHKFIEAVNFNKNIPENHNFCTTSINDKFINVYDKEKNRIIKVSKDEIHDRLIYYNFPKIDIMFNKYKKYLSVEKAKEIEDNIKKLKEYIYIKKSGKKIFNNEMNLISYNERDIIQDTWKKSKITNKQNVINNSLDEDSDTDIDSDSDEDTSLLMINRLEKNIKDAMNTSKIIL